MHLKNPLTFLLIIVSLSLSAQTQSWQWVKSGGSTSDNSNGTGIPNPAECKIGGCDAYGNVYAVGWINGPNMKFDTFSSGGCYNTVGISYLLFSYDCAGNMRWAKQIGDDDGDFNPVSVVTDPQGYTYLAGQFTYGYYNGLITLSLGDSILVPGPPTLTQPYMCMAKFDSLGKLVWFKNFEEDTAHAPHVGSYQTAPLGLRMGSSGNIWMLCQLDSDYAISSNLHTTLKGFYNVEVDPNTGNILGGYYTANTYYSASLSDDVDIAYDMDENENFYMIGTMANGGILILSNQTITATNTSVMPFIFSLDRQGNFRFIDSTKRYCLNGGFLACKWNSQASNLVNCWLVNDGDVYGNDTFNITNSSLGGTSRGLLSIDSNGNILYGKYLTDGNQGDIFQYLPVASYADHAHNTGLLVYNNTDTFYTDTNVTNNYTNIVTQVDRNGNIIAIHTADIGAGTNGGYALAMYGATDWRGNVYLGGTVTNYFATPADSVVNTDSQSGNFFIAKLGIADCSCPTPEVQFTQTTHGDTVFFYGGSSNHSDSIRWRLGDGGVSSSDTFFHVYTNHDSTYTVTAIAYSGCGVDSITKLITVTSVGIKTVEPNETNLYPNPTTNSINLDISGPATIGLVYANGSSVWSTPVKVNQQGTYVFDMSKYSCAMYYFIVQYTNGKTDVMQMVKE